MGKAHKTIIQPHELIDMPRPPEELVWDVCNYTTDGNIGPCIECPALIQDDVNGPMVRGCYDAAEQICLVVQKFMIKKREA